MVKEQIEKQVELDDDFWANLNVYESKRKSNGRSYPSTPEYELLAKLIENITISQPKKNDMVTGTYRGVTSEQHTFSVPGFKDDVYVENRPGESKYLKNTQVGDKIDVLIIHVDEDNYHIKGSISAIYESKAHESLKALEEDLVVLAQIRSLNPAGYDIDILHDGVTLPGFMPNTLAGINKLHDPNSIVGQELNVMIESYSEQEGTYIVSRRKYLKTLIPSAVEELQTHTVYEGHVTGTTPFGVFVEFNECLTGMIHKANINPEWADRLSEIKPGMGINFYVKETTKDKNGEFKIILTQVLRESLWDTIKIGQVIEGRVRDNKPFGTLVTLDDETMGLIHSSEMEKIGRKFQADQDLKVKVLAVDRSNRKIFLTVA
jgi:ribosomal protein S1